jgi:hypothetical protein
MWRGLLGLFGRVWRLAEDNDQNKAAIQELRREMDELADQVKYLAFELQRTREHERHERDKLGFASTCWGGRTCSSVSRISFTSSARW